MKLEEQCDHPRLFFGEGSYYVICRVCMTMWVHTSPGSDIPTETHATRRRIAGDRVKEETVMARGDKE